MRPYEISDDGPVIVRNGRVATFDCDETLVTLEPQPDGTRKIKGIKEHIELLKDFAHRDFFIVVWSDGGYAWAEEVVKTLQLENFVDLIMEKPIWYVDDKEATDWVMKRVYKLPDPKILEAAKKIMAQNQELFEDLAKGPKCDDKNCKDCYSDEKE